MVLVTEDAVRSLAAVKGRDAPVVSVYLDVDGRRNPRRQDYEQSLTQLVRTRRGDPALGADLDRIEAFVRAGVDRSHTRGLAMFSCAPHDFWEAFTLAVPVRTQMVVNHSPHVRQLESLIHNNRRFGVLVVDRQRARVFVFDQCELIDHTEHFDQLPRHDDDGGEWDRDHVRDHAAALAHAHIRRATQAVFEVYQQQAFDHLILAAPTDLAPEVERELHRYLRDLIAARVTLATSASVTEIARVAMEVDAQVERAKGAGFVAKLRDRVGGHNGAVAGIEDTLAALAERRVETLLLSEGYETPGWRCWTCDQAAARGRKCPACGHTMEAVDDVVEEAVEIALGQSCRVVTCIDDADLDVLGRIGALLRF